VGTRKVNCCAATGLRMAAQSLHHSKSALGDFYRRTRAKLGAPKAITATAHKLARIVFHLVTTRQEFDDSHFAADQLRFQTISWIPGYGSDSSRLADSRKFVVAANLASESLASL
jgi:hypothetical protein